METDFLFLSGEGGGGCGSVETDFKFEDEFGRLFVLLGCICIDVVMFAGFEALSSLVNFLNPNGHSFQIFV